jgi:hypothetical protein
MTFGRVRAFLQGSLYKEPAMKRTHLTGGRLGLVLAVAVGVLLGAVFGQPGNGTAASRAVPTNKTIPKMYGTAEVGLVLKATKGTWTGRPTSFSFAWFRCNASGCVAIPGATAQTYRVKDADVGYALDATVTAKNASGAASASTGNSTVVPPSGCPQGTGPIQISQLAPPQRLEITHASVAPRLTRTTRTIQFRFEVTACGGRPVQGATVLAIAIPYNQFAQAQGTTGADGTLRFTEVRQRGFPASPHQRLLAVFARAWRQGDPLLGGVSSSRVLGFRIASR